MKLYIFKQLLIKELKGISRWDDAEVILDYYLKEANKEHSRVNGKKKNYILWWSKLTTNDKSKMIQKMFEEKK